MKLNSPETLKLMQQRERESTFFTFSSWIMTHRVKNRVPLIQILKLLSWHYYVCNLSLSSSHCFYGILSSFNFVAVFSLIINVLITLIDLRCFCSNWIWCALLFKVWSTILMERFRKIGFNFYFMIYFFLHRFNLFCGSVNIKGFQYTLDHSCGNRTDPSY
jgi:hypothetical protein